MQLRRIVVVIASVAGLPLLASAHPIKGVGDFYAGMLHPLTSLDFVLPVIALALLAGQQRRTAAIGALAALPIALVIGATASVAFHFSFTAVPGIVVWLGPFLMSVAGLCVALSLRGSALAVTTLFAVFGFILGSTQGLEITPPMSAPKFILGVGCCGLILTVYGIGLVRRLKVPWTQTAVRVVGSWVAAAGLMVLALAGNHAPR
jgi:urease accessory protein